MSKALVLAASVMYPFATMINFMYAYNILVSGRHSELQ